MTSDPTDWDQALARVTGALVRGSLFGLAGSPPSTSARKRSPKIATTHSKPAIAT